MVVDEKHKRDYSNRDSPAFLMALINNYSICVNKVFCRIKVKLILKVGKKLKLTQLRRLCTNFIIFYGNKSGICCILDRLE